MLAEIGTGRSGSRIGRTERVALRVPHHVDGSAGGTSGRPPTSSAASAGQPAGGGLAERRGHGRVGGRAPQLG